MPGAAAAARGHALGCSVAQQRHASTLTKAGVPKPRPEVETAMSTHHGGHITRLITFTTSLADLNRVVSQNSAAFSRVHWATAAVQLERLCRWASGLRCMHSIGVPRTSIMAQARPSHKFEMNATQEGAGGRV
jgi:hypothetical protein